MTIYDLISSGVELEGKFRVSSFDTDGNETVYYEGSELMFRQMDERWSDDMDISYMFAVDGVLHIELVEQD